MSGTDIGNNNSGNVGIGTTSPAYKLDVRGKTHVQGNVYQVMAVPAVGLKLQLPE